MGILRRVAPCYEPGPGNEAKKTPARPCSPQHEPAAVVYTPWFLSAVPNSLRANMAKSPPTGSAERSDSFPQRHLGPRDSDLAPMLELVGAKSLESLVDLAVPQSIRLRKPLDLPPARGEAQVLADLRALEG